MTPDEIARKVAAALPCDCHKYQDGSHHHECVSGTWPAVEALVREAYEAGKEIGYNNGVLDGKLIAGGV